MSIFLPQWNSPGRSCHCTAPAWKREMLRLAVEAAEGGKLDMGALMKQAIGQSGHCALQEGCAQVCLEAGQCGHSLSAEALELDEFETLSREKA
jgi:leucyl-tRNA synthetase